VVTATGAGFPSATWIGSRLHPDAEFAAQFSRAEKYLGWPMLVVMALATE
jgi:hypothetical protein